MWDMIIGALLMLVGVIFGSAIAERKDARENVTSKYARAAEFNPSTKLTKPAIGDPTFCSECDGPFGGWLEKDCGGHWDTCPNRPKA